MVNFWAPLYIKMRLVHNDVSMIRTPVRSSQKLHNLQQDLLVRCQFKVTWWGIIFICVAW